MLINPHPSDINFSMRGKVRRKRDNFFIDLYWKGERLKLYSTKEGDPFYSERQANRILEKINAEIDADEFNPKNYSKRELKALRLDAYATAWLGRQRLRLEAGEISHGYFRELRSVVNNHLIPNLGSRDIRNFTKGILDDFLVTIQVSPKSKKNILGVLRAIFTDAHDREDITRIPNFPQVSVADPQVRWLDPDAQDAILAQFTDPVRKAFFALLVHMGIRPGEARALKWEDVDLEHGLLHIHAAMDLGHFRNTTKEQDERWLPIPPELKEIMGGLERGLGFVFTLGGRPYAQQRIGKWWRKAATAAGYDISLYMATKHSLGCRARLAGVPLDVIQDYFGHKSAVSTRRYAKIQTETFKKMHRPQTVPNINEARIKANKKE
jgi:integrase